MQQRPGRTILTILSIVIGVTAAVAVGLGTAATRTAYQSMFALVTGKATLEVTAKGGGAFPESVVEDVRKVPGVKVASPVIDRGTSMSFGDDKRTRLKVLGVDPKVDPLVRDYKFVAGRNIESGDELALDEGLASNLGLQVGDKVKNHWLGRAGWQQRAHDRGPLPH
jgi:putative ABC transport system permease protein